ncbi:MAG: hypothetical protein AUI14_18335 [Actinobacteria bacterium 13_2_20CM_2_71_6]|nr:MAG: hypothetical protein AUI14_18335 [Actinobacteria bacterium 13_2_20CM_2_71_6]
MTYAILPTGQGLRPLPPSLWESWDIRQAAAQDSPGAVIAAIRRAHGLNQAQLGSIAGFSQSAISRLESGGNLAFDVRLLRIFQRVLGIPAHLLGLSDGSFPLPQFDARRLGEQIGAGSSVRPDSGGADGALAVDCHTLTAACTSSVLAALPVDSSGVWEEDHPIDPDVVRRLLVARRLLNDSDNWLGSGDLARAVRELYGLVDRTRRAARGELRRQLLDVAALYAEFSGWLHQEVGDLNGAVEWTERALQQSQAAEDPELVAYVYVRMGQLAEVDGDGDRVIGLARAAQRERGLSPEVRALALQQEARGHAAGGEAKPCLIKLDEATVVAGDIFGRWTDEYRVGYYFTQHHLHAERSARLLDLGRPQDAIELYRGNQASRAMLCQWEQGIHLAKLARAYAESGELEQAAAAGFEALAVGRRTGAVVVTDELRKLNTWRDVPAIAPLARALDPGT